MAQNNLFGEPIDTQGDLFDRYGVPPFSVLDTKQDYWQKRVKYWKTLGIQSEIGRDSAVIHCETQKNDYGLKKDAEYVSIFDPNLCELMYNWFCPKGGNIIDPFAGGSVRGIVANMLGYHYIGVDLRQEQIDSNKKQGEALCHDNCPKWLCGDSEEVIQTAPNEHFDMAFTCPPYHDLEVYSDDSRDLSNMSYDSFLIKYQSIIKKTSDKLKPNSFFVLVVGDLRDKNGNYKGFVKDTIIAAEASGLKYYNDMILLNSIASASMRASKVFDSGRKVTKVHQNVLVFLKGDAKKATQKIVKGTC